MTQRLLAGLLTAVVMACLPGSAMAALGVSVSPTRINVAAGAGGTTSEQITLSNPFPDAQTIVLTHADLGFETRTYHAVTITDDKPETTSFSTRGWFTLTPKTVHLKPQETKHVALKITVPDNTPSGTYLGAVLVQTTPSGEGAIGVSIGAGISVFVVVDGGAPPRPRIKSFDVPKLLTSGPVATQVVLDNDGDAWFNAAGTIRVDGSDTHGATIGSQVVLPHRPRTLLAKAANTDRERATTHHVVGTKHLGIGRHTVTVRLRIEPTGTTLVTKQTFWIIPMWLRSVAVAAGIVLAGVLTLVLVLRPRARSQHE